MSLFSGENLCGLANGSQICLLDPLIFELVE